MYMQLLSILVQQYRVGGYWKERVRDRGKKGEDIYTIQTALSTRQRKGSYTPFSLSLSYPGQLFL